MFNKVKTLWQKTVSFCKEKAAQLVTGLTTLLVVGPAAAATEAGSAAFQSLYEMLEAWANGYFGKSLALLFLLVGLAVGVIRGSIMGAVAAIACAIALLVGPDVIIAVLDSAATP